MDSAFLTSVFMIHAIHCNTADRGQGSMFGLWPVVSDTPTHR
jgi:hypothetical protein